MCVMRWEKLGVLVLLVMLLTACGNKGPLMLPDVADDNVENNNKPELKN